MGIVDNKTFLFFAYRDWAINIFNALHKVEGAFTMCSDKTLCTKEFVDKISPDLVFFYGWSWYVPEIITSTYICLCLHPSPLPKYRGGSPIQNQVIAGEKVSAVSIFKMVAGIDDGPICYQKYFVLDGNLKDILQHIETIGIIGTNYIIEEYKQGSLSFEDQQCDGVTEFSRRKPEDSEIKPQDFLEHDAQYFYNMVRSLQRPYPECFIKCKRGRLVLKEVCYE